MISSDVTVSKVGIIGCGRIGSAIADAIDCEVDPIGRNPTRDTFDHDLFILAVGPEKYSSFSAYCESLAWIKDEVEAKTPIGIVAYTPSDNLSELKKQALGCDRPVVRFLCTIAIASKFPSKVYYLRTDGKMAYKYLREVMPESLWADISQEYYPYEATKLASAGLLCKLAEEIESGLGPAPNPGNEAMTVLEEAKKMIRRTMSPEEAWKRTATPGGLTRQIIHELDLEGVAEVVAEASQAPENQ